MSYLYFKAIHIIFVVTWFAGLFYIPRLFIYFAEAEQRPEVERNALQDQFKIMQKRLWYGITWPSCILTILFGLSMLHSWFPLTDNPWLIVKLCFVFFLFLYHLSLGHIRKKQELGESKYTSNQLRMWNEVSTIFLIAIVFLVVLKSVMAMGQGLIGLVAIIVLLMTAITVYRKKREKSA